MKDAREKVLSIEPVPLGAKKRRNTNAFRMNRIPLACQHCGCKVLKSGFQNRISSVHYSNKTETCHSFPFQESERE